MTQQPQNQPETPTQAAAAGTDQAEQPTPWWRSSVVYQVYPRSYADANGDGVGDLAGITSKIPHLAALGVDAVWISPFYTSPMADAGYDVADYRDIDPVFGTLEDADTLIAEAGRHGIRIIVDLVPNHTSDEHAWFQAALAAGPGSPERARYLFRDGKGESGEEPPNSWESTFGGPAWTRVTEPDGTPGQWYLHLFDSKQPDLDWTNPEVREEFHDVLRFWLDRGVAGFRVDVAHSLVKADGLPEWVGEHKHKDYSDPATRPPMWDQDGVHEIYREWRAILDSYDGDRMLVAEAWVEPLERLSRYVRPDEMHQAFNFRFMNTVWGADSLRTAVRESLEVNSTVGAPTTWVLSNHDVVRHASRLGLEPPGELIPDGVGPNDPQPDEELGLRRARAETLLMLALPGSAYLYQGEELGLPDHTTLPDDARHDPTWFRTKGAKPGRDGCRVPVPWAKDEPAFGFNTTGESWLPQPESYGRYAADQQEGVPGSTLELYRTALRLRRELRLGEGEIEWAEGFAPEVVAAVRSTPAGTVLVVANPSSQTVTLPDGVEVLVTSAEQAPADGTVPPDTAVWARLA